jgi:hypothetical protein
MPVRPAETRDLPEVVIMFAKLLKFLEGKGNGLYTKDANQFTGGIIRLLGYKLTQPGNIVLVKTDNEDNPVGFLVGGMIEYPGFFADRLLGEVQWMYPFSFSSHGMVKEFDKWAQSQGATARACYATPTHSASLKAFERNGMVLGLHHYYKHYDKEV